MDIKVIRKLVGSIQESDLQYVESFVHEKMAIFLPVTGPCLYSISPDHSHPAYMVIITISHNTKTLMNGKIYSTPAGMMSITAPEILHSEIVEENSFSRYYAILIDKEFFREIMTIYTSGSEPDFAGKLYLPSAHLKNLINAFCIEARSQLKGREQILSALELQICHSIFRAIFTKNRENMQISERFEINNALEYIHTHLDTKINVALLAAISNMSVSHFTRIFTAETGKSPVEYITETRLNRVKCLLNEGNKSVLEIALECGFNNASYLNEKFKQYYQLTPIQYQKLILQKAE